MDETNQRSSAISKPHMTRSIFMGALTIYLALTMTVLDGNIVNVALPSMSSHFHVSRASIVWVINAYQIIITMLILAFASLGDIKGYKKIFLMGVVFFTLGSAACALSDSFELLVASRILEGFGAAAIMSVNIALIRFVYPKEFLSRGLSYNAVIVGAATAIGPTLAGAILQVASWHWLFIINIPLGIMALIVGLKHLPGGPYFATTEKPKFDTISALESALVFGLIINIVEGFSRNTPHWQLWLQSGIVVVVGILFIYRQLTIPFPLFPLGLFKIKPFTISVLSSMSNFVSTMLAMVSLPFFLKEDLGYDLLHVGLLISPWPIAMIVASLVAGRLSAKYNLAVLSAIGMGIAAVGLWLLRIEPADAGFADIAWRMAICGIGFGLFKTPNNVLMIKSSPLNRSGAAGGIKSTSRLFGQCIGTAMVAIIFHHVSVAISSRICLEIGIATALIALVISLFAIKMKDSAPN